MFLFCCCCSRLFSTGHLASSASFYFSLWLWFTMLPAQYAILHPIPTGLWKGWWETPCSISLALYHLSLHCCPGIVSSLVCESTSYIWWGGQERFLFPLPFFLFILPANSIFLNGSLREVRLSNIFCAPDHRNGPMIFDIFS